MARAAKQGTGSGGTAALVAAQSGTMKEFEKLARGRLGRLLGAKGLRRVDFSTAIATNIGGGLLVQAAIRHKKPLTLARIREEAPPVGLLANSIPLIDPVSLTALPAGVWVVRLRPLPGGAMALDFLDDRSKPVFGTRAQAIAARQTGEQTPIQDHIDIEIDWPNDDPKRLLPPGTVYFCVSYGEWKSCFFFELPEINWPDWF